MLIGRTVSNLAAIWIILDELMSKKLNKSTPRAQTSLAETDNYPNIEQYVIYTSMNIAARIKAN